MRSTSASPAPIIESVEHADKLLRFFADQVNCREIVNGRIGTWAPTQDPRELIRRAKILFEGRAHFEAGDVRHDALRTYVEALADELEPRP